MSLVSLVCHQTTSDDETLVREIGIEIKNIVVKRIIDEEMEIMIDMLVLTDNNLSVKNYNKTSKYKT